MKRVLLLIASAALFAAAPVEAHGRHGGHRHRSCHYHWKYDATHCHRPRGRYHRHRRWEYRHDRHGHYYDHRTDLILKFDF